MMVQVHYKVVQDKVTRLWFVYDNWEGKRIRSYSTRKEARWAVNAYNAGRANELESKPQLEIQK